MHCKNPVGAAGVYAAIGLLWAGALAACASNAGGTSGGPGGGSNDASGSGKSDSAVGVGSDDSGMTPGTGDSGSGKMHDGSPGSDATTGTDGGRDATPTTDGGVVPTEGGGDAGGDAEGGAVVRDVGSCCSAQTTPGCDDPNLEVCVCANDPSCCSTAWGLGCALIVQQKYCQTGVRDCVCGTDAGQWGQTACCTSDWSSTCDSVATLKCGAAQGCF